MPPRLVLFFKSDGQGWFAPPEGTHLPSSEGITSLEEAKRYWLQHFGGKTIPVKVHEKDKQHRIRVVFSLYNDHAYTDSLDAQGRKLPERVFSQKRSRVMSRLLNVISRPVRKIRSHQKDLLIEGAVNGEHYTVVLAWEHAREFKFISAHFKTAEQVREMLANQSPRKTGNPLHKSATKQRPIHFWMSLRTYEGPSVFRGLAETETQRLSPPQAANIGPESAAPSRNRRVSMPQKSNLGKANPTPAQLQAGNYRKQHIRFQGLEISIENPAGSVRSGVDPGGKPWSIRMRHAYGYILGSRGVDKDHVDCYVGPDADAPTAYVVHQRKAGAWDRFDEDKVMLGFASQQEATRAYLAHYDDPRFLGPVTAMPMDEFKAKIADPGWRGQMLKSLVLFFPMTASRRRP